MLRSTQCRSHYAKLAAACLAMMLASSGQPSLAQTPVTAGDAASGLTGGYSTAKNETMIPPCPCCTGKTWACCSTGCSLSSVVKMSTIAKVQFQTASTSVSSTTSASSSSAEPVVSNPLGACPYDAALDLANYAEAATAKAYYESAEMAACIPAAGALRRVRDDILTSYYFKSLSTQQIAISKAYADFCMAPASQTQKSAAVYAPVMTPQDRAHILERLVLLVAKDGRPVCHGYRFNDQVLTAEHCAENFDAQGKGQARTITSATTYPVSIVKRGSGGGMFKMERDYLVLKLHGAPAAAIAGSANEVMAAPIPNARLLMAQVNVYKLIASAAATDGGLGSAVVFEDNPFCRLFGVSDEGFLLHACSTESRTSGLPLFQKDAAGKLRLVGIHNGATLAEDRKQQLPDKLRDCALALPNYGTMLRRDDLRQYFAGP